MHLDQLAIQRLRSHIAEMAPKFDQVYTAFATRLLKECPQARGVLPELSRRNRYNIAAGFGMLAKNIANLDGAGPTLASLRHAAGDLTEQQARTMHTALMNELREAAGASWSPQLHNDWSTAITAVFEAAQIGRSAPATPMRMAA